jgi:hypothetical protein
VNGCAKSRHGIVNGANDGGWANLSDVVSGMEIESESVASANANAVDAKDEARMRQHKSERTRKRTSLRLSRSSGSQ